MTKPVRHSQLRDVVRSAMVVDSRSEAELEENAREEPAPPTDEEGTAILVVEDNAVNASVVLAILKKQGYASEVAVDGREALKALARKRFAAVLMDCHMPELDGYATTIEIRLRESSDHRTPVIALTANAMKGDREACLAVGMDDYLSKPVRPRELEEVLTRWVGGEGAPEAAAAATSDAGAADELVDRSVFDELREAGPAFLEDLVALFAKDAAVRLEMLGEAVQRGDAPEVRSLAHTMKGAGGGVGAVKVTEIAAELESRAAACDLSKADALLAGLEDCLERTRVALKQEIGVKVVA